MKTIINFFKTYWNVKPKIGDKVRTYVGFGSLVEGIVSSVHDDYCWIDRYFIDKDGNRRFINSSTASFLYCHFEYLS